MPSLSTLFFVTRPWSFPVTVSAIAVGGSLAFLDAPSRFSWPFFVLSLLGALFVHAAANLINTYGDYQKGVDVKASADDRAIVDGLVTAPQIFQLIVACVLAALTVLVIMAYHVVHRPPPTMGRTVSTPLIDFLLLCAVGLFLAYAYTAPPFYWKYRGLGDLCMIIAYGPLLVAGGYFCQLSTLPSLPSLWFSLMPGLTTDGILHVNNTRDIKWDAQCGAVTLPMKLGPRLSVFYFTALYLLSFVTSIAAAIHPATFIATRGGGGVEEGWKGSWAQALFLLPLLLIPDCVDLVRRYVRGEFRDLCPRCGEFAGKFGLLQSIALCGWAISSSALY